MRRKRCARWTLGLPLAIGLAALVAPSVASGAMTVGQTFTPPDTCLGDRTLLQTGSPGGQYTVPLPGVITSWSFQAPVFDLPNDFKLKVGHPEGGNNFTIVGERVPTIRRQSAQHVHRRPNPGSTGRRNRAIQRNRCHGGLLQGPCRRLQLPPENRRYPDRDLESVRPIRRYPVRRLGDARARLRPRRLRRRDSGPRVAAG